MLRQDVVEELLEELKDQYKLKIEAKLLNKEVSFKDFLKYRVLSGLNASLIIKSGEHTMNVAYIYVVYFATNFNIDDIFKFLETRGHRYEPSEKTYKELTTMLISSVTEDRFSAITLMKFLYSGSH